MLLLHPPEGDVGVLHDRPCHQLPHDLLILLLLFTLSSPGGDVIDTVITHLAQVMPAAVCHCLLSSSALHYPDENHPFLFFFLLPPSFHHQIIQFPWILGFNFPLQRANQRLRKGSRSIAPLPTPLSAGASGFIFVSWSVHPAEMQSLLIPSGLFVFIRRRPLLALIADARFITPIASLPRTLSVRKCCWNEPSFLLLKETRCEASIWCFEFTHTETWAVKASREPQSKDIFSTFLQFHWLWD